jgi:NADH-quinone oxidoreductase subunit L
MTVGGRLSRTGAAFAGVGSIGLSALITLIIAGNFLISPPAGHAYTQTLWTWFNTGGFSPAIALRLDALSLIMTLVVTFVGFLIHLYSSEYMIDDEGYSRFFAYMNLFVASMLVLVLADNLLLLYLGWEGVGLCSYLLIGFWYKDHANGIAAIKAFVVTRVGDAALAVGLFLLFYSFGTLNIQEILRLAPAEWAPNSAVAVAAAALILGGAVGKSAQLPLQVWLPDAMAGPTPVSALIHAATMVTAGVYLIARTHALFALAPSVQLTVAIIGAVTLLLSSFSALAQHDIKRVLAYSTISQIGYMFLALGVGAWSAAIFHFMTHAFFKALLFLGAGVVIIGLKQEHNMFKMGGLRKQLPVTFWTFLIGSASLSALPLVTAGFYSKDLIIWDAYSSAHGDILLWLAGLMGALLTSIYTFRMVFLTFYGDAKSTVDRFPGLRIKIPLVVLAFLSLVAGFLELPRTLGGIHLFTGFLHNVLPEVKSLGIPIGTEALLQVITALTSLTGVLIAYVVFLGSPGFIRNIVSKPLGNAVHCFLFLGWNFDLLYDKLFVRPFVWLARTNKKDVVDLAYRGVQLINRLLYHILSLMQNGKIRWYAMGISIGTVIIVGIMVFS